jgi:hypothetical protein
MEQSALVAFGFDPMERGELACRSQKYGVKDLLLLVSGKLPAIG